MYIHVILLALLFVLLLGGGKTRFINLAENFNETHRLSLNDEPMTDKRLPKILLVTTLAICNPTCP